MLSFFVMNFRSWWGFQCGDFISEVFHLFEELSCVVIACNFDTLTVVSPFSF